MHPNSPIPRPRTRQAGRFTWPRTTALALTILFIAYATSFFALRITGFVTYGDIDKANNLQLRSITLYYFSEDNPRVNELGYHIYLPIHRGLMGSISTSEAMALHAQGQYDIFSSTRPIYVDQGAFESPKEASLTKKSP